MMNNNNLLILGAGGHGRVVKETAVLLGSFGKIDFLDDNAATAMARLGEYHKFVQEYSCAFVAIGEKSIRQEWVGKLKAIGYDTPAVIHPKAWVSPSAVVAKAAFVGAEAVVNTQAVIEEGVIIGIGALVDHDAHVGAYSYVKAGELVKAGTRYVS